MKNINMNNTLEQINAIINGNLIGEPTTIIEGFSAIDEIQKNTLIFIESEKYLDNAIKSDAAAIIVPEDVFHDDKPLIQVKNPTLDFLKLINHFYPAKKYEANIHPQASIAKTAKIGKDVHIGASVVIGENCQIGDSTTILAGAVLTNNICLGNNCCIHPNTTIYENTIIGNNVTIHANTVIGSDGFGYKFNEGIHQKVPHIGHVVIDDDVEIGANSVVDRASIGTTHIGKGTKIDNLVQVAHSVKLGQHNILCAMTGVAGSSTTGDYVIMAANVGVADHVNIGSGVKLGARTGVPPKKNLPENTNWFGSPARPEKKAMVQMAAAQRLPELVEKVKKLQKLAEKITSQFPQE